MTDGFPQTWQAKVLTGPPMIAPARSFVLPQAVPGEEDALARGALWIEVMPRTGGTFLLQCALGFAGKGVATGVWSTPEPDVLLAVAGGYGYLVQTTEPERSSLLPLRPVVEVNEALAADALVLLGFHALYVLQPHETWQSPRISWEGVTISGIAGESVEGTGWHLPSDRELPFALNLRTKQLTGGAFNP
jgi:hypothetical protein